MWPVDGKEEDAKTITGSNHGSAAEDYALRYIGDPSDGEDHDLYVKNASGDIKKVNVMAFVSINWEYEIRENEDERAG